MTPFDLGAGSLENSDDPGVELAADGLEGPLVDDVVVFLNTTSSLISNGNANNTDGKHNILSCSQDHNTPLLL
jgi:hypothetical protein